MISNQSHHISTTSVSLLTIKYFGKDVVVANSDKLFKETIGGLLKTTSVLKAAALKDSSWDNLSSEVALLSNYFLDPNSNVKRYQIEVVNEGLVPYLNKLNSRLHFDKQRFRQINAIISAILNSNPTHPCFTLMSVDEIVNELRNNRSYIWKSELLTILETAVDKQWQPIITDNRNLLLNLAGKFVAVGLVGVVGWPLAFLYPLYRVALNMTRIATEYEQQRRVTLESIVEVCKTLAVIFACNQLLSILSLYSALGHFCLLCGGALLFVSANRALIKQLVPVLAPHIVQVDLLLSTVDSLDHRQLLAALQRHTSQLVSAATQNTTAGSTQPQQQRQHTQQQPFVSAQVEELPEQPAVPVEVVVPVVSSVLTASVTVADTVYSADKWNSEFEDSVECEEEPLLGRSESFFRDAAEYVFAEQQQSSKRGDSPFKSDESDSNSTLRKRK